MADDLVKTLTNYGETIKSGIRALKNWTAPEGPGWAAPPLIDTPSGKARINRDGSPPVLVDDSIKKVPFKE
jgi:hypothetical protein